MTLVDKLNEMYEREEWNPEWVAEIGTALKSSGTQPTIDNTGNPKCPCGAEATFHRCADCADYLIGQVNEYSLALQAPRPEAGA